VGDVIQFKKRKIQAVTSKSENTGSCSPYNHGDGPKFKEELGEVLLAVAYYTYIGQPANANRLFNYVKGFSPLASHLSLPSELEKLLEEADLAEAIIPSF